MISSFFHMLRGARVGFVLAREGALALVDPSVLPPLARGLIRVGRLIERRGAGSSATRLAAAMTRAYNRSSVALFTLVIPEQDLSDGIVTVASAEGYIGSVTLSGESESGPAPLIARMAAVCDVYDAVTSRRPYHTP